MIKIFSQPRCSAINIHLNMKRMLPHCNADTFTLLRMKVLNEVNHIQTTRNSERKRSI